MAYEGIEAKRMGNYGHRTAMIETIHGRVRAVMVRNLSTGEWLGFIPGNVDPAHAVKYANEPRAGDVPNVDLSDVVATEKRAQCGDWVWDRDWQ